MVQQGKDSPPWAVGGTAGDKLTIAPVSCLHALLGEEGELRKKKRCRKVVFKIYFTSDYPVLILLVTNPVNIPNLSPFCPWGYLLSDLSCSLSQLMNYSLYFLSPVILWRGLRKQLWWVTGIQPASLYYSLSSRSPKICSVLCRALSERIGFFPFFATILEQLLQETGCLLSMEGLYSLQFCFVSTLIQADLLLK